jgi:deoxyribonuclease V
MRYKEIHPWKVNIEEAVKIQDSLRRKVILNNKLSSLKRIASVDVGFFKHKAKAVVCVFDYPELGLIETKIAYKDIDFPYIAGFLSFREGPVILEAFKKIENIPDLVIFDAQGICHPRRLGLATHLGIILDIPTIGCTKTHFYGKFKMPKEKRGSFSYIYDEKTKEILGIALRTRSNVKPVFVSAGFKIELNKAKEIILNLCRGFRIPEPLRFVDQLTKDATV